MARWWLALVAILLLVPSQGRAQETPSPLSPETQVGEELDIPPLPSGSGEQKRKKKKKKRKKKRAAAPAPGASIPISGAEAPSTAPGALAEPARADAPKAPPPESADPDDSDEDAGGPGFDVQLRASVSAGAFQGWQVRKDGGALVVAEAAAIPTARYGDFILRLPLRLAHRQTFGASLPETQGLGGLELTWKQSRRLKLSVEGGLVGFWRPGWPDLYQPLADGSFAPTSRASHLDRRFGAELVGTPMRRHRLRLSYRYALSDYATDPAFQPIDEPMHLTPLDHTEHALELGWRYVGKGFRLMAGVRGFARQDSFLFARDAGTGRTHAGPGGLPPNPLQSFRGGEPSVGGKLWLLQRRLELEAGYGLGLVEDRFQGYYSYTEHHPELRVDYSPVERVSLRATAAAWLRSYGENSYVEGPGHPPLTSGDRRVVRRGVLGGELRFQLRPGLTAKLEGRWVVNKSNFPPYVPGVFPRSRAYDIDWNYQNWLALGGLEYRTAVGR
ncbi:MAG: hypothetical protein JXB05_38695 [Myxococcaceae bacterium]|nr:hypothetical protein [Myxococcaceae bacterium]